MSGQSVEYFEIDIPYCSLTYGVPPCMAELGVTGEAKCFQTLSTCQDIENINLQPVTLRFAKPAAYLPRDIDCLPWITSLDFTPSTVSLGENLGQRAVLKVTLSDHKHSDAGEGLDKYHNERGYNPYERGTFWPRFRARHPSLQGVACRWRIGFSGDALEDMETRHFFVESHDGPNADGSFSITAKDALKFLDGDRAQIPLLSNGFLAGAIDADDTAFTLSPAGIGNAEYPASGHGRIAGREDVAFTRSGDAVTITGRAQFGTTAASHSAGDRFQIIQRYAAMDPADIINHVITNYTDLPSSYIPLADWQEETTANLGALYTFTLGEPVSVSKFLSRVIEQAGLAVWDDPVQQKLQLRVIRAVPITAAVISETNVVNKTFDPIDQPEKRVSRAWVYYGLIDPTKRLEDTDNYRSTLRVENEASEKLFGAPAIRKVFADGIAQGGNASASRIGSIIVARNRFWPRRFKFSQMRGAAIEPVLGSGYNLDWRSLQDPSGARELVPVQAIRIKPSATLLQGEFEEMRFDSDNGVIDPNNRLILINFNDFNLNLRAIHDQLYPSTFDGVTVTFVISQHIGSSSNSLRAIDVGTWPVGVQPIVSITGRGQGAGGNGGSGIGPTAGQAGGTALYTRSAINLAVSGQLWGGGGGGGAGVILFTSYGGSGGAGTNPGSGGPGNSTGVAGNPGTSEAGGASNGLGGAGGGPGLAGLPGNASGSGSANTGGGAAGKAIDGVSFCTTGTYSGGVFTPGALAGDIRGPQV